MQCGALICGRRATALTTTSMKQSRLAIWSPAMTIRQSELRREPEQSSENTPLQDHAAALGHVLRNQESLQRHLVDSVVLSRRHQGRVSRQHRKAPEEHERSPLVARPMQLHALLGRDHRSGRLLTGRVAAWFIPASMTSY